MDIDKQMAAGETCRLLAVLFYEPKGVLAAGAEEFFTSFSPVATAYDADLEEHFTALQEAYEKTDLTTLQVDYAALFVGPAELLACPFGSIHLEKDHQLLGETTAMVQRLDRQAGLQLDQEANMVPDHIAVELEFLHYLLIKRTQSKEQGLTECLTTFLTHCFRPFAQRLSAQMITHARTDFYRIVGKMLQHVTTTIDRVPSVAA